MPEQRWLSFSGFPFATTAISISVGWPPSVAVAAIDGDILGGSIEKRWPLVAPTAPATVGWTVGEGRESSSRGRMGKGATRKCVQLISSARRCAERRATKR